MLNLNWLQTFCTLVETGHFTQTAEKLFMTQPGVSQHIRKLEEHYGHLLLDRRGKEFSLTEAGSQVYQEGRLVLANLAGLEQGLREDPPYTGLVKVTSPAGIGLMLYPALLAMQQEHPQLIPDFRFASNPGIESTLLDRQVDIGLMTRETNEPELRCKHLADQELCLLTADSVKSIDWQTLLDLGYHDHPDGTYQANLLLSANFPEYEDIDQFRHKGYCNQVSLSLAPISLGFGFTILPAYTVKALQKQYAVTSHHLEQPAYQPIYLCYRKHRPLPARVQNVIQLIEQLLTNGDSCSRPGL